MNIKTLCAIIIMAIAACTTHAQQLKQIQKGTAKNQIPVTNGAQNTQVYRDILPYLLDTLSLADSIPCCLDSIFIQNDTIRLRDGSGNAILPKWYKSSGRPSAGSPYKHGDFYVQNPITGCASSWELFQYINDEWIYLYGYECPLPYMDGDPNPTNELADFQSYPFNAWAGTPKKGDIVWNTAINKLSIYNGSAFVTMYQNDTTTISNIISDSLSLITTEPDSLQRIGNVISLRDGDGSVDLSDLVNVADSTAVLNSYGTIITESPSNTWNIKVDSSKLFTQYDGTLKQDKLPSLTNGSVIFSDGTTLAQDNSNLFWDDSNNRLGIGTNSPSSSITIKGATTKLQFDGAIFTNNGSIGLESEFDLAIQGHNDIIFRTNNINTATEVLRLYQNGNIQSSSLVGTGDRMLKTSSTGVISTSPMPSNGVTSVTATPPLTGGTITSTGSIGADTTSTTGLATQHDLTLKQDKLTGANKRIPYFTGASTLSNSDNLVFDNATKYLGIGTASPDATIHMTQSTGNRIRFTDPSAGTNYKNWQIFAGSGGDERNLSFQSLSDAGSEYNFMTFRKNTNSNIIGNWYAPFISSASGTSVMTINEVGSIYRDQLKTINGSSLLGSGDVSLFTLPSLTSGSVLFSNGTTLAQDNSNLFWNNSSKLLGIGTNSPSYNLHVAGSGGAETIFLGDASNNIGFSINAPFFGQRMSTSFSGGWARSISTYYNMGVKQMELGAYGDGASLSWGYLAASNRSHSNPNMKFYGDGRVTAGLVTGGTSWETSDFNVGGKMTLFSGYNQFIGHSAGNAGFSGYYNDAMGYFSAGGTANSLYSQYFGYYAGYNNTGSYSLIMGNSAGFNNTGTTCVLLGNTAGYYNTRGNSLYIENSTSGSPLIGGQFDNRRVGINTAIGSIANTLHVTGGARVTDLAGSGTRMVTANASGDLGFADIPVIPQTFALVGSNIQSWGSTGTFGSGRDVGLGVDPTRQFDNNGDTRLRGAIYDSANSAGSSGQVLTSQGTGAWTWTTPTAGATDLTFTGTSSPYTLNSSTGTDVTFSSGSSMSIVRGGNGLNLDTREPTVNTYTTVGTGSVWAKPTGARMVYVKIIGGGGGGAGGSKGTSTGFIGGGGGGCAGGISEFWFRAIDLPANVTITVGGGGTAGAGATSVGLGGNGAAGSNSIFGIVGNVYLQANGGAGGIANGSPPNFGLGVLEDGGLGGFWNGSGVFTVAPNTRIASGGGGAGASINNNVVSNGNGAQAQGQKILQNPIVGTSTMTSIGSGGGNASISTNGTAGGGNAAFLGAGGGGGGASTVGNGGSGGVGGRGEVQIITYY